jgi:hypothetical protein
MQLDVRIRSGERVLMLLAAAGLTAFLAQASLEADASARRAMDARHATLPSSAATSKNEVLDPVHCRLDSGGAQHG